MTHDRSVDDRSEFLRNLRQARRFLDKPVPQGIVDELVEAARTTDGDSTDESRRFLVVDDLETRKALSAAGTFAGTLGSVGVVIVVTHDGGPPPSRASVESRIADRIMVAAGRHGLASTYGWFATDEAQEAAQEILGLPARQQVLVAVGVGYVDESPPDDVSSLQRVRNSIDALARIPRDGEG